MTRCIVAADDFAYNAAIDDAILALIDAGVVTATSCLTAAPRWAQSARLLGAARRGRADVGVHVDLTEFERVAPSHALLSAACYAKRIDRARVRSALQAQLQRFEDALGTAPDYVDGHRHVHQLPVVRDVLTDLLRERYPQRLPWVRISRAGADAGWKGWLITQLGSRGLAAACASAGIATNARLLGIYDFTGTAHDYRHRADAWLADAAEGDALMCHPAARVDAADPIGRARVVEFEVLSSAWWTACLATHDIQPSRGVGCVTP